MPGFPESAEETAARIAAHLAAWQSTPCPTCEAPLGAPCRSWPGAYLINNMAHPARIWVATRDQTYLAATPTPRVAPTQPDALFSGGDQ